MVFSTIWSDDDLELVVCQTKITFVKYNFTLQEGLLPYSQYPFSQVVE